MEPTAKTNRLALISFIAGLITLISLVAFYPLMFSASPGTLPPPSSPINTIINISRPIRDLGTLVAIVAGFLALSDIKKKGGAEKGKRLAWIGIILGAAWILFRIVVAAIFILALLFS